ITGGLSNISYGLPHRRLLNRVFVTLCMGCGLDSGILDPTDKALMASICAAEALLGHDDYCMNYINAARGGKLMD
ncbi:MAG: methyltetrahydrofolate cobalamin methyltransferase, partial [Candidatus Zipacnadales bacterium]